MQSVPWQDDLKQESVSLVTRVRMGATPVILGSDLAQEEIMMTLTACGNDARFGGDNGDQRIKAMGYILVQWKRTTFNTHYIFVQGAKKTNRYVSFELFGHHQYWPEMWKNGSILRSLLKDMQFTVHER